uniref:tripartite tricarboxylate transporter substrate binding protein n=1 Tax=Pararhizobium sp. IMCC3301 TaxID=3067904 RepID=UPI00274266B9|nr:tripartite tricarboxylate transporter substrate binding protein [Pararhizobium sp. IMCC3301]
MKRSLAKIAATLSLLALAGVAPAAAEYPEKPITLIVAYSPGGGTDTAARTVAKYVEKHLGQRLVVENKAGAGGQIGFSALAKANPDGYEIGFINVPSIQLVKRLRDNVPYEMADFAPIANIQLDPVVIAVETDSPYQTLGDLLDAAKADPSALNIGADGPQSNNQLQLIVAEDALQTDFNFIAFDGSGPAIKATLGGDLAASLPSASSAGSHVDAGRLRLLGVFADERSPLFPDVPTVSEAAGTKVPSVGASLRGIAAPAGISDEHKARLEKAFADVMADPEFLEHAKTAGLPLKYMDAAAFETYLQEADAALGKYIDLMK